mgnify:CR=1 FL=1
MAIRSQAARLLAITQGDDHGEDAGPHGYQCERANTGRGRRAPPFVPDHAAHERSKRYTEQHLGLLKGRKREYFEIAEHFVRGLVIVDGVRVPDLGYQALDVTRRVLEFRVPSLTGAHVTGEQVHP